MFKNKAMQKKVFACVKALGVVLLAIAPAEAITNGVPDNNGHPNAGSIVVDLGEGLSQWCSGTLISPTVFLTAAHCTSYLEARNISQVYVSFDSELTGTYKLIPGTMHTNPKFNPSKSDPGDMAVIKFAQPVTGITPAKLPKAGLFDQMSAQNGLKDQTFTVVGYGKLGRQVGSGQPTVPDSNQRMVATSSFRAINPAWLHLSQNSATGDGGACFGDSGGPNFLAASSDTIVAMTVMGDAACRASYSAYRLDTESAREFLKNFVTLP
jgi:hypothetical protein